MPRIALIANEQKSLALIAAADRLPGIECTRVSADASFEAFDAVAFCNGFDGGLARPSQAASDGKHLLIDLATVDSQTDLTQLIATCDDANVRLMISQPLRFLPSVQAIRNSLDAGQLGAPGVLRIHRWADQAGDDINQLLVCEVDLANWLFGQPPNSIYAIARGPAEAPELLQVHLGFEGGGSALIDVTTALPAGDDYYSLSIIAADGSAYVDDHHDAQLLFAGGRATTQSTGQGTLLWTALLREFAAAIEESREPSVGGAAAVDALTVMAAIRQSIDSGNALRRQGDRYEPA